MDSLRLLRGFESLESAAAAVNALCDAGVDHGAIAMRANGAGVYLVIVQAADDPQRALAEQVLGSVGATLQDAGAGRAMRPAAPH